MDKADRETAFNPRAVLSASACLGLNVGLIFSAPDYNPSHIAILSMLGATLLFLGIECRLSRSIERANFMGVVAFWWQGFVMQNRSKKPGP